MFTQKLNFIKSIAITVAILLLSTMSCYASGVRAQPITKQSSFIPYFGLDVGYIWSKYEYQASGYVLIDHVNFYSNTIPRRSFDNALYGIVAGTQFAMPSHPKVYLAGQMNINLFPHNYIYTDQGYTNHTGNTYAGVKRQWQGDVSVLGGYHVWPTVIPYLRAGIGYLEAVTQYYVSMKGDNEVFRASKTFGTFNWLVGAGVEKRFPDNFAVRLEYDLGKYSNLSYTSLDNSIRDNMGIDHKLKFSLNHIFRANFIWYF